LRYRFSEEDYVSIATLSIAAVIGPFKSASGHLTFCAAVAILESSCYMGGFSCLKICPRTSFGPNLLIGQWKS